MDPNPTVTVNSEEICSGDTATLTASPVPADGGGDYTYDWFDVPGLYLGATNTATINTTVPGIYKVRVTDGNGCTAENQGEVTLGNAEAQPNVTPAEICFADLSTFDLCSYVSIPANDDNGDPLPAGTQIVYLGYVVNGVPTIYPSPTTTCPDVNSIILGAGNYAFLVRLETPNNCLSVRGSTQEVVVNAEPACSASNSSEPLLLGLCEGQTLGLSVLPADTNVYTYLWESTNGSAIITNANMPNATADNVANGEIFRVTITNKTTLCYSMCTTTAKYYNCAPNCETAFGVETKQQGEGYVVDADVSSCFANDGFKRWGWVNKITDFGTYEFEIYRGAGRCDLSKGTYVGTVTLVYADNGGDPNTVDISFDLLGDEFDPKYVLNEAHVWIGCEPYPRTIKGDYTVAPGQYNYNSNDLGYVSDKLVVPTIEASGEFYFIAHTVVCDYDVPPGAELPGLANTYTFDSPNSINTDCYVDTGGWGRIGTEKVSFTAYPVPFEDEVNISYKFEYDTDVKINVYDIKGALIRQAENTNYVKGTVDKTTIDLSRTDNQMYFVRLTTSEGTLVKKIISSSNLSKE